MYTKYVELFTRLKQKSQYISRRTVAFGVAAFLLGSVFAFSLRFILVEKQSVHYHANFALYVNGQRELFDDASFYEEVASCSITVANPKSLVHMHDNVSHVVHAHNDAATWGLFFQNISYSVSRTTLITDDGLFLSLIHI